MLREITAVRQIPGEPRHRWFQDDAMDLFVWFAGETIVGFQLSYDKLDRERTLTWRHERDYDHTRTDDGSRPGRHPATPILVPDGAFDVDRVTTEFDWRSAEIDGAVGGFVAERIRRASGPSVRY